MSAVASHDQTLYLRFHGRIIDSLGIQMYQSPVAAIAELVANAWDADATEVDVTLPDHLGEDAEIVVADNGTGMTFGECQECYLNVGRNRRMEDGRNRTPNDRPLLGRKGIGKFAGFGIADIIQVETTSKETGERTVFELNLRELRKGDYVDTSERPVTVLDRSSSNSDQEVESGTVIRLRELKLTQVRQPEAFARNMARRFLINQQADNFVVRVNGYPLPEDDELQKVQFDFPNDYLAAEQPDGLVVADDRWGEETVAEGQRIRWRIRFCEKPIETDELRGISVFCGAKVAQTPFFFHLAGGLGGQHGQQYMFGMVKADYLDQLQADIITTERQRINWEVSEAVPLLEWGRSRVRSLLKIWQERRAQEKVQLLEDKLAPFSGRMDRLQPRDRKIVEGAIKKLASIETLSDEQFSDLSGALLTAWEGGRLKGLIEDVADVETMDEGVLLSLLAEAQVLNALHVAEAVKSKLSIVHGLRERIEHRELENAVRDYIAGNPWLLSPEWETFRVETSLNHLIADAAKEAGLEADDDWRRRVDLVLASGRQLLVVEFMRPGLTLDRDHLYRFQTYIDVLRAAIRANSALGFEVITGLVVADNLARKPGNDELIQRLQAAHMHCLEWRSLLARAEAQWKDFLHVLVQRAPQDERLQELRTAAE